MQLMKVSKNFRSEEFLPKCIHDIDPALVFRVMDERQLITQQALRDRYGPWIVNNWHVGGQRQWSGYRPYNYYLDAVRHNLPITSQHHFGRATDSLPAGFNTKTVQEIREDIIKNRDKLFPYLNAIELDVGWLHTDCRIRVDGKLLQFKP